MFLCMIWSKKTSYKYCSLYIPGAHFKKYFEAIGKCIKIIILFDVIFHWNAEGDVQIKF